MLAIEFDFSPVTAGDVAAVVAGMATIALAILTLLYVLATRDYVRATREMVAEMRESRIAQQRPYVVLDFENPRYSLCDMVIKNIGNGSALRVKVSFDPDPPYREGEMRLSELPVFTQLEFFAPGREFRFFYKNMVGSESGPKSSDANIVASLSYSDTGGVQYTDTITLNPYIRWYLSQLDEKGMNDLVKVVEAIPKELRELKESVNRLDNDIVRELRIEGMSQAPADDAAVTSILLEVKTIWQDLVHLETGPDAVFHSPADFQAWLYRLGLRVLAATSATATWPKSKFRCRVRKLRQLAVELLDAGDMQFYIDGGSSGRKFQDRGKKIVKLVDELIK